MSMDHLYCLYFVRKYTDMCDNLFYQFGLLSYPQLAWCLYMGVVNRSRKIIVRYSKEVVINLRTLWLVDMSFCLSTNCVILDTFRYLY